MQQTSCQESFRLGPDGIYRCEAFQEFVWQKHGFGTRDGNPAADVTLRQIHSDRVVNANGLRDREREGDALVTDEIGRSIGIRTADCVPILMLDAKNRAVAAVHAGWRGTAAGVVAQAIGRMRSDFGTDPQDIYAALGPCIRGCCYEVGQEVAEHFEAGTLQPASGATGKHRLNLAQANRRQMETAGVYPERIFDCDLCTTCQSAQFFSYRREPENPGRMMASISRLA
ncbi:MAG TPA: peptidoglycan editing factor PgeF [Bryobacteraceae bacterium]|nr:peptidoglycan editing factor PgeF [Bryobacteraceae bacterium]